jgi:hypothetical protein
MPSLDPESTEWIERARRGERPYSYIKMNDLLVVSLVKDHSLSIQERICAEGHAWWRAINQSTVRSRRVRIIAKLRDRRGVWRPDQRVQGDDYCIDEQIPRTKRDDNTFFKRDWSARFGTQAVGAEAVIAICPDCRDPLESAFIIHPSETSPVEGPMPSRGGGAVAPKVFISYSSRDKKFVRRLTADLQAQSLDVWVDEQRLEVGASLAGGISKGLEDADYFIPVLSAAAAQSPWVREELNAAMVHQIDGKGAVVLPVRLDGTEPPILLRGRLYADFRRDYATGLESLLRALRLESVSNS